MTSSTAAFLEKSQAVMGIVLEFFGWGYWAHIFAAIFILGFILVVTIDYRARKRGWLSQLIEKQTLEDQATYREERKKLESEKNKKRSFLSIKLHLFDWIEGCIRYFKDDLPRHLGQRYLPSWPSLLLWLLLFFVLFILSHGDVHFWKAFDPHAWFTFLNGNIDTNNGGNIVTIVAGLATMVFALVIFIVDAVNKAAQAEGKRILLKISNLWFLACFTILALVNFLVFVNKRWSILFPIIIGAVAIHSFWRIIHSSIDLGEQERNRRRILKDRIDGIILGSIQERIGNNILLGRVGYDKEIKVEYAISKHWLGDANQFIFLESQAEGWLADINLYELKKLADYLEKEIRILGTDATEKDSIKGTHQESKKIYLLKRYGQYLPPESIFEKDAKFILAIPKGLGSEEKLISYIKAWIPYIFRFKVGIQPSELFRKELQGTKDDLVKAIRSTSLGAIQELKESYKEIAESFLETLQKFGGGFSAEQAKKEQGSFSGGWDEVRWLSRDLRELLTVASASNNRDVIADIAYLPVSIAARAVQARDHLLFQEFLGLSTLLYHFSQERPETEKIIRDFIADRSWRYIKELTTFYIEPLFGDDEDLETPEHLIDAKDFAVYSLKTFQFLLKAAFDNRDFENFSVMLDQYMGLYKHLSTRLNRLTKDGQKDAVKAVVEKIYLAKQQILFGLSAKILDKYFGNKDDAKLKEFFEAISQKLPTKPEHFAEVYESSRARSTYNEWGWDDWEMVADGEVHWIDVEGKLDRLFCVQMLRILLGMNDQAIARIQLPPSRSIVNIADGPAATLLGEMQSNPEAWSFVLQDRHIEKIKNLISLLADAKNRQEKEEEQMLQTVAIDPEKLEEFKKEIKDHFEKDGCLRPIAVRLGFYEDLTDTRGDEYMLVWGYNEILEKAGFIKQWHVHYVGRGEIFGGGMARTEDRAVFEDMIKAVPSAQATKVEVVDEIEKFLTSTELTDPIIIHTLRYPLEGEIFHDSKKFIPHYRVDYPKSKLDGTPCHQGVLNIAGKSIPVVDLFVDQDELINKILVIDLKAFGSWQQFSPIKTLEDEPSRFGVFYLKVTDFNQDDVVRNGTLKENPTWLHEQADKEGYLRQRVVVRIYERFKIDIRDPNAGKCFNVTQEQDVE